MSIKQQNLDNILLLQIFFDFPLHFSHTIRTLALFLLSLQNNFLTVINYDEFFQNEFF